MWTQVHEAQQVGSGPRSQNIFLQPQSLALFRALAFSKTRLSPFASIVGFLSALLHSAVLALMMYAIFDTRLGANVPHYSLYILVGVSVVSYFNRSCTAALEGFTGHRNLLLNSTVSRAAVLGAPLVIPVCKFTGEMLVYAGLCAYSMPSEMGRIWALSFFVPAMVMLAWGVGVALCLLNCFVSDLPYVWGVVSRVLFFATPIFYEPMDTSGQVYWFVYWVNPLTPFVAGMRAALLGRGGLDSSLCAHVAFIGIGALILGLGLLSRFSDAAVERV